MKLLDMEADDILAMVIYSQMVCNFYSYIITGRMVKMTDDEIEQKIFQSAELSIRAANHFFEYLNNE